METTKARADLEHWRADFMGQVANPFFAEALFDRVPDIVFSVKDTRGRYVCISEACAEHARCPVLVVHGDPQPASPNPRQPTIAEQVEQISRKLLT